MSNAYVRNDEAEAKELRSLTEQINLDYQNEKAARARIACAVINRNLHEDPAFQASSELVEFGPRNDYNGHRSAAHRVRKEWEERILGPGLLIAKKYNERRALETEASQK